MTSLQLQVVLDHEDLCCDPPCLHPAIPHLYFRQLDPHRYDLESGSWLAVHGIGAWGRYMCHLCGILIKD